jgi:hypothetical protein
MALGPVQYLVIGFDGNNFRGEIFDELTAVIDKGLIEVIDLLFVMKSEDGSITIVEMEDIGDSATAISKLVNEVLDLVSEADMLEIAQALDPNTAAAILVFEHKWAKGFADAVVRAGGFLADSGFVPREIVENAEAFLASN